MKKLLLPLTLSALLFATSCGDETMQSPTEDTTTRQTAQPVATTQRYCNCDTRSQIPIPICTSCHDTCLQQHLNCHEILEDDFNMRAYHDASGKFKAKTILMTDPNIKEALNATDCENMVFVCKDTTTYSNDEHANDHIFIRILPINKKSFTNNPATVYYKLQIIKGIAKYYPETTALRLYNGKKCDNSNGEDILLEAVKITGTDTAVLYRADLSSDYPTT